ncbi:hypothetical protein C8J56DRAFT_904402 [Mycena floridula]|nr:hypothetical protein C8J56DRAFT_904402 [Mycena floridula]
MSLSLYILEVGIALTMNEVWPLAFWTLGQGKIGPAGGEIDILEGIDLQPNNQMSVYTSPGCIQAPNPGQTGQTLDVDCSLDRVGETKPNSFGSGFAAAGSGVYAMHFDNLGIIIYLVLEWQESSPSIARRVQGVVSWAAEHRLLLLLHCDLDKWWTWPRQWVERRKCDHNRQWGTISDFNLLFHALR